MLTYKQFLYCARISGPKLFPRHKTSLWLRRTASPPGYGTSGLRHSNTPLRRKDATEITGKKNWKICNERTWMHVQKVACWLAVKFALLGLISDFKNDFATFHSWRFPSVLMQSKKPWKLATCENGRPSLFPLAKLNFGAFIREFRRKNETEL